MTRQLGSVLLDNPPWVYLQSRIGPPSRDVQVARQQARYGRQLHIRDDWNPLTIELRGYFLENPTSGMFFRDFAAALLTQQRAPLILGDGTQYEWCDVQDCAPVLAAGGATDSAAPQSVWAWTSKVLTYEPFAREIAPVYQSLGSFSPGASAFATLNYAGTVFAEPTWVVTITTGGCVVTNLGIHNAATNETVVWWPTGSAATLAAGSYYVIFDASGGRRGQTPDNSQYAGVPTSAGYGASLATVGGPAVAVTFYGNPPTLIPNPAPTMPPTPYANVCDVLLNLTSGSASASWSVIAPARYLRN